NPGIPALVLRRQSVGEDAADPRTKTAYNAQQRPQQYANRGGAHAAAAHEECRGPDDGAIADQSGQRHPDRHGTGSTYTPEYGHAGADIDLALGWRSPAVREAARRLYHGGAHQQGDQQAGNTYDEESGAPAPGIGDETADQKADHDAEVHAQGVERHGAGAFFLGIEIGNHR